MKKFFLIFCLLPLPAFALMSPWEERILEWKTLLESKELVQYFTPNEKIEALKRVDDSFVVKSEKKQMVVEIKYLPPQRVGPRRFQLIFHPSQPVQE